MSSSYGPAEGASASTHAQESIEQSDESPEGDYDDDYTQSTFRTNPELWSTTAKKRGRQPKDPYAEHVRFDCKDVDDLEEKLKKYLKEPSIPAEHATVEFHFPPSSAFMVYTRDFKRDANTPWTAYDVSDVLRRTAVSVHDVLKSTENSKDEIVRQKAVARICVEAIQRADGFRYSFHNNWLSREDKAHRFSFFCNDSTLNKGRAAGGGQKGSGKAPRKPIYECNGLIAVKFSITKNNLEVHYRHIPVHKTYEERAPPPRKSSKRYRLLELLNPDALSKVRRPSKKKARTGESRKNKRAKTSHNPEDPQISGSGQDRDGDLQPLIDFIGMAEGVVPEAADAGDSDSDGIVAMGDGDVTAVEDATTDLTADRDSEPNRSHSEPVCAAEKAHELGNANTSKRKRRKRTAPESALLESAKSGGIIWTNAETPRSFENAVKGKNGEGTNAANDSNAPAEPIAEIEALKKKLLEAEQRIQKLEAAKTAAVPPYPAYPPYPYHYPYPPPLPGYGYPPYPTPIPGPPTNSQPLPPPLQIQHHPSTMGPPNSVRSPHVAVSPAYSSHPNSANPTLSPAHSRPPNSAGVGPSPTTPNALYPPSTPTLTHSPHRRGSAATNLSVSSPHPKQNPPNPSPVTPISAPNQYPLGGILVPVPNTTNEAARIHTSVPKGVSVWASKGPPPPLAALHYSPVPIITAASWEPVVIGGSSRHQHPKWQTPRTAGSEFSPVPPSPAPPLSAQDETTPVSATPLSATAIYPTAAKPSQPHGKNSNFATTANAADSGDGGIPVLAGISEAAAATAAESENQDDIGEQNASATGVAKEKVIPATAKPVDNDRQEGTSEETAVVINE